MEEDMVPVKTMFFTRETRRKRRKAKSGGNSGYFECGKAFNAEDALRQAQDRQDGPLVGRTSRKVAQRES